MIARLKLLWRALTWPTDKFYGLVSLSFANDPSPHGDNPWRYQDSGEGMTLLEGMVVVSYVFPEHPDGRVLMIHRPFYDLKEDPDAINY